jgi:hypothetical protein
VCNMYCRCVCLYYQIVPGTPRDGSVQKKETATV